MRRFPNSRPFPGSVCVDFRSFPHPPRSAHHQFPCWLAPTKGLFPAQLQNKNKEKFPNQPPIWQLLPASQTLESCLQALPLAKHSQNTIQQFYRKNSSNGKKPKPPHPLLRMDSKDLQSFLRKEISEFSVYFQASILSTRPRNHELRMHRRSGSSQ